MSDRSQRTRLRTLEGVLGKDSDKPFAIVVYSWVGTDKPEERWAFYHDGRRKRLDGGTGEGVFDGGNDSSSRGDTQ